MLHRLVQAYVVLRCAYPRLCPADAIRLFLVPIGRHHRTAAYVASHDGWYRRHIYAPHCAGRRRTSPARAWRSAKREPPPEMSR